MVAEAVYDALVVELARDVVRDVAPQEMPLFRANSQAYLKDPQKAFQGARGGDQFLGFGSGAEITLITPAALAVASAVIQFIATEVARSAKQESGPIIRDLVKGFFAKFRPAGTHAPAPLTRSQLAAVRDVAFKTACRMSLPPEQAQILADSTVGSLAVA